MSADVLGALRPRQRLTHTGLEAQLGRASMVYLSTLAACSISSWLLAHSPASMVTPFTLLVPLFGLLTAALHLGETLPDWKLQAAAFVTSGLVLRVFGPRPHRAPRRSPSEW